ncbi:MAG: hypothetical protein WC819_04305 [Parcubacteria group bacterium]|jgi:hypothetical protein
MDRKIITLKNAYIFLGFVLVVTTVLTPLMVRSGISFVEEETVEVIMIITQFIIGFVIYRMYRNEMEVLDYRSKEAVRHIGTTNVEIQSLRKIFDDVQKYPRSSHEFGKVMADLTKIVAGITKADHVLLRIIDIEEARTVTEKELKNNESLSHIGNKELIDGLVKDGFFVVSSRQDVLSVKVFCIFNADINDRQRDMLQRIVEEVEMIYVLFSFWRGTKAVEIQSKRIV